MKNHFSSGHRIAKPFDTAAFGGYEGKICLGAAKFDSLAGKWKQYPLGNT